MSCNSAMFAVTPTVATVAAGGALPLTTIARRISPRVQLGTNSANLPVCQNGSAYYELNATVTFTAQEAGDVTITAYQNGEPIVGITATETITTAETETRTISLAGLVRVRCEPLAITLVNASEVAITTTNVALTLVRVD